MFRSILRFLLILASNTALLYYTSMYLSDQLWFALNITEWFHIMPRDTYNIIWVLILWFVFWLFNGIIGWIIKLITLPLRFLTLWLSNIFVNIGLLYAMQFIVNNNLQIWFTMTLWTAWQVFVLSVLLAILSTIIHFIIKKII